ncbi:MAG: site-2 protease family protein, partial [Anaerolineae bacterium]|nr:site-2 protease family protein [Anaerolineae bacterium]
RKAPSPRIGMALSALAGPFSNFIQAFILALLLKSGWIHAEWLVMVIVYAIAVNIGLIVFNMLPIPPLDGSRVLAGVAPPRVADFIESLEPIAPYLLLAVLFVLPMIGIDLISWLSQPIYYFLIQLLLG